MIHIIETQRLLLIPTEYKHAPFIIELLNSKGWLENIGDRNVRTTEEAEKYITKVRKELDPKTEYGQRCIYVKALDKIIGTVGIFQREGMKHPDVGFALLTEYFRQGYSYEASLALLDRIKELGQTKRVEAIALPNNKPSTCLLEKLGLTYQNEIRLPNDSEALALYAIEF